uniref:non-specific serine/threonine protein kinase n=1 Tax=Steinernema glaseri TaxID=37863 RepID=A0A1I7ZNI0_9BILA
MPCKERAGEGQSKVEDVSTQQPSMMSKSKAPEPSSEAVGLSHNLSPVVKRRLYPRVQKNPPNDCLMQMGEALKDRWLIKGLIGSGGYGQIYFAIDKKANDSVAVKVEPTKRRGKTVRRMILEQRVLLKLQGKPHAPVLFGSGVERDMNYIVMQLLSVNVGDLRKQSVLKRLSVSTTARIMQQAIRALKDVHQIGFLHRDVKPANMCFGVTEASKHRLVLVDFGLVRRFRNTEGKMRERRPRAGFRGTLRYVSPRVHEREEQGPSDDLIALLYSMIELIRGELPWRHMSHQKEIKEAKDELRADECQKVSECVGDQMKEYGKTVLAMSAEEEPNYTALQDLMKELSGGRALNDPYDWENEYADVVAEVELNRVLGLAN